MRGEERVAAGIDKAGGGRRRRLSTGKAKSAAERARAYLRTAGGQAERRGAGRRPIAAKWGVYPAGRFAGPLDAPPPGRAPWTSGGYQGGAG